ncbi:MULTISPECIES: peptidoglycan-binding protein [unclassified Streptomyces]|uniref:peptidoglycan-binding protein n=1 Tax=unclassified Streptomyces TaxID=2593676 RepID=UPI000B818F31|nr:MULTISPECIES: peptidoglycan-binding protein [unclassified Streptomyces]MYS19753.1 helix-turn-helix domain-containing protein [Streptomyces sp. SID4948]
MPRWKALPTELDPRMRQLVARLRLLKDHSGLSLRQLSTKTGYSAKSWERYLGGRSLPPREAVEALARIAGLDPVRLLALREVAAHTWGSARANGAATADSAEGAATELAECPVEAAAKTPEPELPPTGVEAPAARPEAAAQAPGPAELVGPAEPVGPAEGGACLTDGACPAEESCPAEGAGSTLTPGHSLRLALVAGAVALVLAISTAVLLVLRLDDSGAPAAAPAVPSTAAASSSPPPYTCRIERVGGLWSAGISRSPDANLGYGAVGPGVAEAQCLLRRAGISPGGIDGMFGPLTQRAVMVMQQRSGLVVDGIIGPKTWKALRG